jgi:hypothetical protein
VWGINAEATAVSFIRDWHAKEAENQGYTAMRVTCGYDHSDGQTSTAPPQRG